MRHPVTKDQPVSPFAFACACERFRQELGVGHASCFMSFRGADVNAASDIHGVLLNEHSTAESV